MSVTVNDKMWVHGVQLQRYADALIEIAAAFNAWDHTFVECVWCEENVKRGCRDGCPGLLARRALGVA